MFVYFPAPFLLKSCSPLADHPQLTIKKRAFKVKTLNSIFHACYDPAEFFDRDLFLGAFMPALLALLIW